MPMAQKLVFSPIDHAGQFGGSRIVRQNKG